MKYLIFMLVFLFSPLTLAQIDSSDDWNKYLVGIKHAPPFSFKDEDGKWTGLSVDLIDELKAEHKFRVEYIELPTITALLAASEYKSVDFSIGAISMTDKRERVLDFSHPYFVTTPGLIVKESGNALAFILSKIALAFTAFIFALYFFGFIVSRLDPDDEIDNIHKGAWFVLTTFTTTGYGDYVPKNGKAKVFAAMLMIISMFALSAFTAYVASALTVRNLTSVVTTVQDLFDKKVAVVGGSTGEDLANILEINTTRVTVPENGIKALLNGDVAAFIYDKAMLDYLAQDMDNVNVYPIERGYERYGIAFPSESELREPFNISILGIVNSPEWKQLTDTQYFK